MRFQIEVEREKDGRWIAEVPDLPGVMVYGPDRATAVAKVQALALRVLAERVEHAEVVEQHGHMRRTRLAEACALLNPAEERALAEEDRR
jgi:predicted RNase H-like HicB family nuclease